MLACFIDASTTGMVLASLQEQDGISLPTAAAGAADIANVVSLLAAQLALEDGPEDVMVTFRDHFHVIRSVRPDPEPQVLLLVILDRLRTNLAKARREIRQTSARASPREPDPPAYSRPAADSLSLARKVMDGYGNMDALRQLERELGRRTQHPERCRFG